MKELKICNCLLIISHILLVQTTDCKIPRGELDFYFINSFNQYSFGPLPDIMPVAGARVMNLIYFISSLSLPFNRRLSCKLKSTRRRGSQFKLSEESIHLK